MPLAGAPAAQKKDLFAEFEALVAGLRFLSPAKLEQQSSEAHPAPELEDAIVGQNHGKRQPLKGCRSGGYEAEIDLNPQEPAEPAQQPAAVQPLSTESVQQFSTGQCGAIA